MGALTVNRKRGFDHCTPPPNSILYSQYYNNNNNSHSSSSFKKTKKMSSSSSAFTDQIPIISSEKVNKSRLDRYPGPVKELKREVHAPCCTTLLKFPSWRNRKKATTSYHNNIHNNIHNEIGGVSQCDLSKRVSITTTTTTTIPLFWNNNNNNNNKEEEQPIDVDDIEMGDIQFVDDVVLGNHKTAAAAAAAEFGDMEIIDESEIVTTESDEKHANSKLENNNNNNNNNNTTKGRRRTDEIDEDKTSWDLPSFNQKMLLLGRKPVYKELWEKAEVRYNPKLSSLHFQIQFNEKRRNQFPQPVQEVVSEQVLREAFLPLSEEEKAEVSRAFSDSNRRKVLATHDNSNIAITGEILQCLRPREWLNDEVINVYMELLKERERRDPKKYLNCHFFNTFFYKKLCSGQNKYDYKSVRRWTTQRKLGYALKDCDKIFVPIHRPYHWCLAIINKKDSKFQYLDSLGGTDSNVLKALARYYVEEVKDKSGENIDVSSWKQENVTDLPAQKNGFDCGVFMVKYTDFYSRGLGLCFKQDNMPYFRLRTAKEILRLRAE